MKERKTKERKKERKKERVKERKKEREKERKKEKNKEKERQVHLVSESGRTVRAPLRARSSCPSDADLPSRTSPHFPVSPYTHNLGAIHGSNAIKNK